MMITDEDAAELKTWVVKKLEDISDADSDVLADYVLALIRADTPEPELKINAIENLEDFLKDNTVSFVNEIFLAIQTRSYMPGYVPSQAPTLPKPPFTAPSGPAGAYGQLGGRGSYSGLPQQSRKRSYNDRQEDGNGFDLQNGRGDRQMKYVRRGGGRGRGDTFDWREGRGGFQSSGSLPGLPPASTAGFPATLPALPFDISDPLSAIMAMQSMGFPAMPGLPPLPQAASPVGYQPPGGQRSPGPQIPIKQKINARCRDYDTKGFCARGNSCPFEHGNDHIVVPGQLDEYDPKNSVMLDIQKTPNGTNGHSSFDSQRGNDRGRGRGHGRGDRGGFNPQRRNRADFSHAGPNHDRSITTIVVEQIPEEKFDEQSVGDFFSEFGNIQEVTMQAYKRLALVKYDDYFAAKRAYESPRVIFDNRFVKVYWYKPDSLQTPPTNGAAARSNSLSSPTKSEEPSFDKEKFERDAMAAQKKLDEKKALQRDTDAKRQELEKQKEELARKQAEEKRKLMEKLRAKGQSIGNMSPDPKIETNMSSTNGAGDGKTSAQTEALRAQLAALEEEAKSLGIDPAIAEEPWPAPRGRGRGRGRGSYRGWEGFAGRGRGYDPSRGGSSYRGRGGSFRGAARGGGAYNLDNRTRRVRVSGVDFDDEKDEALRQYLLGIGEFENIESSVDNNSSDPTSAAAAATDGQIITFRDRFTAEKFIHGPSEIPSVGKLEFAWVTNNTPVQVQVPTQLTSAGALSFEKKEQQQRGQGQGQVGQGRGDGDGDTAMGGASADGDNGVGGGAMGMGEVDYDVAEEDERWMVQ